jgi:broad specificity phosphatase PhoE
MDLKKESEMFDQAAEYYDSFRPSYPKEIIDKIINATGVNSNSRLLEIGAGSGKATELFTPVGYKQADMLGKRLKKYGIDKIYSSKMVRAIQTAQEINKHLGVEIVVRPELREICMGDCDSKGWSYLEENYLEFIKDFSLDM